MCVKEVAKDGKIPAAAAAAFFYLFLRFSGNLFFFLIPSLSSLTLSLSAAGVQRGRVIEEEGATIPVRFCLSLSVFW